jgi:hypothetical protein
MSDHTDPLGYYATRAVGGPPPSPACSHHEPDSCDDCDGTRQTPHERSLTGSRTYRLTWLLGEVPERMAEEAERLDAVYGEMPGLLEAAQRLAARHMRRGAA